LFNCTANHKPRKKTLRFFKLQSMKNLFVLFFLIFVGLSTQIKAQDAVVIKEEGAQEDLDREKDVSELTFRQRIHVGGGISGLSFGNPTSIGLAPMVGYQLGNQTIVGIGVNYQYYSIKDYYGNRASSSLLGENIFIRQNIPGLTQLIGQGYLLAKAENFQNLSSNASFTYSNPVLVGVGIGSKIGLNLNVMYDLNYTNSMSSPYGTALVVQIGGFFF